MSKGQTGLRKRAAGAEPVVQKRKRKRRSRLPKGFDPENPGPPPDPERWLPKWQRSEFKRKRRSRKDKVISLACCSHRAVARQACGHCMGHCADSYQSEVQDKGKTGHQGGAVDESLDRTNAPTEPATSAPNLPKRARARGKSGRR